MWFGDGIRVSVLAVGFLSVFSHQLQIFRAGLEQLSVFGRSGNSLELGFKIGYGS